MLYSSTWTTLRIVVFTNTVSINSSSKYTKIYQWIYLIYRIDANFYKVTYNTFYKTFQTPCHAKFKILQSYAKSNFPTRWVSFLTYNSTFLVLHNRNILNNALVLSCFLFRLLILIPFASWNTTKSVCPVSDIQLIWFRAIFYPYPHCLL